MLGEADPKASRAKDREHIAIKPPSSRLDKPNVELGRCRLFSEI